MTNKEMVESVLNKYGASSAKQISMSIKRDYHESVSPNAVAGILRPMYSSGKVSKSNCGVGSTFYWLADNEY